MQVPHVFSIRCYEAEQEIVGFEPNGSIPFSS